MSSSTIAWQASDGTRLTLRPARPDDAARVQRSLALLSPEARRQRLLATTQGFSEEFVSSLVDGDPARQYALLVVREEGGEEIPVAGGRLLADASLATGRTGKNDTCEFALIVGDRWQGQGIGRNILYALIAEARRRKLRSMAGDILTDNKAMLALARQCGFFIEDSAGESSDDTLRATLDLNALVVTQALKDRRFNTAPTASAGTRSSTQTSTLSGPPANEAAPLHAALLCAGLAMLGLLLAMAAVWLGTGWLDGFDYRGVNRLGRRFIRVLPWALPLAALAGLLLYACFRCAIDERHKGWITFFAVIRAFALFPLLGFAMLFGMLFAFVAAIPLGLYRKFSRRPADDEASGSLFQSLLVVPLWIMTLPFTLLKIKSEGDIDIPARISRSRLINWLPVFFLMLLVGPGFESEQTGNRVDANWLTALATYWLADILIVTGYMAPTLAARARSRRIARLTRS